MAAELARALQAMVDEAMAIAKSSFSEWDGYGCRVWNDEVWRRNDYDGFRLVQHARRALRAHESAAKPRRPKGVGE